MVTTVDWIGKAIYLYLRSPSRTLESGIALVDARLETIEGVVFVTGRIPNFSDDWLANTEAAVRWDDVAHYAVLSSEAELLERMHQTRSFAAHHDDDEAN
jgi:hypothetical protein